MLHLYGNNKGILCIAAKKKEHVIYDTVTVYLKCQMLWAK